MNGVVLENVAGIRPAHKPAIRRESQPGLHFTHISLACHQEWHLSLRPLPGEKPVAMMARLAGWLRAHDALVIRHEVFGSLALYDEARRGLQREVEGFDWPLTWCEGKAGSVAAIAGMHVLAVTGTTVETIHRNGQPVGRVFSDGGFRHCLLGGIVASQPTAPRPEQCREVLTEMAGVLGETGMTLQNVVRTWFFLEDILDWYGEFNHVRNEFFREHQVFQGLVPASTGIGARNPAGSALIAGAWAVRPENELGTVREVISPLQCAATDYGSAFSRAVLMEGGGVRRLLVSGTAIIEPGGRSIHEGDLTRQIETSLMVTEAILKSCGSGFGDVTRATGYFKDGVGGGAGGASFESMRHGVSVPADICRPELLFEIELDAVG